MMQPRLIPGLLWLLAVMILLPSSVAHAQDSRRTGQVREQIETIEETIPIQLGQLQVDDTVWVEVIRLSGDLMPYVSIYNQTRGRYAIRHEAMSSGRIYEPPAYAIEPDAGPGEYVLIVAHEQESGMATSGDFIINYRVERDGVILPVPQSGGQTATIAPSFPAVNVIAVDESQAYHGHIDDEAWVTYFLVELPPRQQMKFVMTPIEGDLAPHLDISPADETAFERPVPQIEDEGIFFVYPPDEENTATFQGGYYIVAATRQGFEGGASNGDFTLSVIPVEETES